MKKLLLALTLIISACSNESNSGDYVGTWIPEEYGNKYSKIEIEKAQDGELRLIMHGGSAKWNFIMTHEESHTIRSKEAILGAHITFKLDKDSGELIDYNLNQRYKISD